jgi:hypothetical protein
MKRRLDYWALAEYEAPTFRRVVERMTNHDRSRWAQAGYPGLAGKDAERVIEAVCHDPR